MFCLCFGIVHEPSHVAECRLNPSLQHPNFRLCLPVRSFVFFIKLYRKCLGKYVERPMRSPSLKYRGFSFSALSGNTALNRFQLSGFILYVEEVMCCTPNSATAFTRSVESSLRKGMRGSILTVVEIPAFTKVSIALSRR